MRFELIDRVLEQGDDRLVAVKNVTVAEEYLGDHFPSFPVLPGVLMLEALVQAARRLIADRGLSSDNLVLAEVRNVRYGNMVRPGHALRVEVTLQRQENGRFDIKGTGRVDEGIAVQGRFLLAPLKNQ